MPAQVETKAPCPAGSAPKPHRLGRSRDRLQPTTAESPGSAKAARRSAALDRAQRTAQQAVEVKRRAEGDPMRLGADQRGDRQGDVLSAEALVPSRPIWRIAWRPARPVDQAGAAPACQQVGGAWEILLSRSSRGAQRGLADREAVVEGLQRIAIYSVQL